MLANADENMKPDPAQHLACRRQIQTPYAVTTVVARCFVWLPSSTGGNSPHSRDLLSGHDIIIHYGVPAVTCGKISVPGAWVPDRLAILFDLIALGAFLFIKASADR